MPVIKIIPSKKEVRGIYEYVTRDVKTDEEHCFSSGCSTTHPEKDFQEMRDLYHKPSGGNSRMYYHMIISYNTMTERISPEEVQNMVEELCSKSDIDNYQWFGAVHYKDRPDHVHCHLIINNVAYKDSEDGRIKAGRSFQSTRAFTKDLMYKGNEICKAHGYEKSLVNPDKNAEERMTQCELALIAKGEIPWKDRLRMQIESAKERAGSVADFKNIMWNDYGVNAQTDRKGCFRYIPKEFHENTARAAKPCHQRRLGEHYSKESIEKYIREKKERYDEQKEYITGRTEEYELGR